MRALYRKRLQLLLRLLCRIMTMLSIAPGEIGRIFFRAGIRIGMYFAFRAEWKPKAGLRCNGQDDRLELDEETENDSLFSGEEVCGPDSIKLG